MELAIIFIVATLIAEVDGLYCCIVGWQQQNVFFSDNKYISGVSGAIVLMRYA